MGKKVFLSYAEDDKDMAYRIALNLRGEGFDVYDFNDRKQRGRRFIETIGKEIEEANVFIACLSNNFLQSSYCQTEGQNAIGWENDSENPRKDFIVAVKVNKIDGREARLWRNYDWIDLTGENQETELINLIERVKNIQEPFVSLKVWPSFQNREEELDEILGALKTIGGGRFYFILSGPQMGKSWLVRKIKNELQKGNNNGWHIEHIDLHGYSRDLIELDPTLIVGDFFESKLNGKVDSRNINEIVKAIARSRYKWLCILDGAELLTEEAAVKVRYMLSRIYKEVKEKVPSADFAFIATSRFRHAAWGGVLPSPRFRFMALSHFETDVIFHALHEMTEIDRRDSFTDGWYNDVTFGLWKATEGLPALLVKYMQWIRDNEYVFNIQELGSPDLFEQLAKPYINYILSREGLLLTDRGQDALEIKRNLLEQVLLGLSVYRVFSISFLDKVLDTSLIGIMDELGWSKEDLWKKILDTASIDNAIPDIWKKTYTAIRRLLFRYKHTTFEFQSRAHQDAGKFYDGFWNDFSGAEKTTVLVERLWHEIEYERLLGTENSNHRLIEFAKNLFQAGITSNYHTKNELSEYLIKCIADDQELITSMLEIDPNLFEKIIQVGQSIKEG